MLSLPPRLSRIARHPLWPLLLRLGLGGLFIQTGLDKLNNFSEFESVVLQYHVLPPMVGLAYARALPWLELMAGGYLVLGLFTRWAAAATGLMMLSFLVAIGVVLSRGQSIEDCGCFVAGVRTAVSWELFWRDIGFLAVSALLVWLPPGPWSLDALLARRKG